MFLAVLLTVAFAACEKVADLPHYANGNAPTLSASVTSIAAVPADSLKPALTLSWSYPKYATDSSNIKYVVQIDSAGGNFFNASTRTIVGSLSTTYTAAELNTILLGYGYAFGVAHDMSVRILSSYANNNEQLASNVLTVKMTPYVVPPKVVPPSSDSLFIVGSATAGGWGNPVPIPAQQFTRLDSVTYEGTFFLNGGQEYLLLPVNGKWDHKYAVQDNTVAGLNAGGDFGYNAGSDFNANFPGPATSGMYKITVDFQHGKFTVASVNQYGLLYVPGDYQGWNPATAATLGSPANDGNYDGYVNIPAGGTYEFKLNTTPDWSNSFGDGGGGTLSSSGGNMKVPGAGFYHISASTVSNTWSATATTWGIIGSFAASGWSNDVNMTYDAANNKWTGTITTAAGDQFKFRANHDWGTNLGESGGKGSLVYNGDNLGDAGKNFAVPAGTHVVSLFLNNSGYYTYTLE